METMEFTANRLFIISIFTILIACSAPLSAKGPVWKVSKGGQTLYLGGTIHLLSPDDYPLPEEFEEAYSKADTLVFETDMSAMKDPATQLKLLQVMMFQDDRTLGGELSAETLADLESHFSKRGMQTSTFNKFTPAGVSLTLTVLELQLLGLGVAGGVDEFYSLRGMNDSKAIEALETVDQQISFIDSLNDADGDEMINSTLRDVADLSTMWKSLLDAWRNGDLTSLESIALQPMEKEFPDMAKMLLEARNNNWMQELPKMLQDNDVEFVLVGSLHLVGENGLLAMLSKAGYKVDQLD